MTVSDFIIEAASKCDDLEFRDFQIHEYKHELYRALRKIVREYGLTARVLVMETDSAHGELTLNLPGFFEETRVYIDGNEYLPKDAINEALDRNVYYLKDVNGKTCFDFYPRSEKNTVTLYYNVSPEADTIDDEKKLDILPEMNTHYEEALLRLTVFGIASIGIARFREERLQKYQRIMKLNSDRTDPLDTAKTEWAKIKPYTFI